MNVTLDQLWDLYAEYRKPFITATHFRCNYQRTYRNAILELPRKNLGDAVEIRDYLVSHKPPATAKQLLIQINACCAWAVEAGIIHYNPFLGMADGIKVSKNYSENIDPFTAAERDAIIQGFEEHRTFCQYAGFVKFLFLTGCRTGEAIGLQWKHINSDLSVITFCESVSKRIRKDTKTHRSRKFPVNAQLKELLLSIKSNFAQPDDLVFTNIKGKVIKAETFSHNAWKGEESKNKMGVVTRLVEEGKVERYRPQYNTRHTFVTMALEAGISPVQVARWVGNSPEIIMKHYAGTTLNFQVPEF